MKKFIRKNFLLIFNTLFIILGIIFLKYGKTSLLTVIWIVTYATFYIIIIIDLIKWKTIL